MAILQKLKSLLGLGDSRSDRRRERDVGVTVERESGRSDATADSSRPVSSPSDENAVDFSTTSTPESESEPAESPVEEAESAETDVEPESEPEPEPESDLESEPEPDVESESEPESEPEPEPEPEPNPEPVDEIKGIGPAYADRLAGAGVETVGELAAADAAELAEQTDISETRIQGWIDRAEVR